MQEQCAGNYTLIYTHFASGGRAVTKVRVRCGQLVRCSLQLVDVPPEQWEWDETAAEGASLPEDDESLTLLAIYEQAAALLQPAAAAQQFKCSCSWMGTACCDAAWLVVATAS